MLAEVVAALVQSLPATALGVLGYVITRQNLENSWRQTLDSISREFWNDIRVKRIRCAVAYQRAYPELQSVLQKRYNLDSNTEQSGQTKIELEQNEYELLDDLDKFLTLLESAALSSPILRDKLTVWNTLYFDYWLQKCMDKEELKWYIDNYFPRLSVFYIKRLKVKAK
jgi:hypothetical protein